MEEVLKDALDEDGQAGEATRDQIARGDEGVHVDGEDHAARQEHKAVQDVLRRKNSFHDVIPPEPLIICSPVQAGPEMLLYYIRSRLENQPSM